MEKYAKKYFKKTIKYIYDEIDLEQIKQDFPVISFDADYLEKLEDAFPDLESRISDMAKTYTKVIKPKREINPIYESISQ